MNKPFSFVIHGKGAPVVLIPGFASQANSWGFQYRALKKRFKVIILENSGISESAQCDGGDHCIAAMADQLYRLVDEHGAGKASILGASMGAMIALEFAQRYPDKVTSLILASLPIAPIPALRKLLEEQELLAQEFDGNLFLKNLWPVLFSKDFIRQDRFRIFNELFMQSGSCFSKDMLHAQLHAADTWLESNRWTTGCNCPCLFIYGSEDQLNSKENTLKKLENAFPKSAVRIIDGAGHAVHIEKHREFNAVVYDFLKNHADDYVSPKSCRKEYQERRDDRCLGFKA